MKIIRLKAENIKKLVAVEIEPSGAVVRITGKNGAGKTSVLDSIFWALGGQQNITEEPIRKGEKKASVEVDLGDIIVKRTFTEGGTALVIENKDGLRFKSPQTMLDGLIGRLTFDPLDFMRQEPRRQFETLRALTGVDFSKLDVAREKAYEERTVINRDVKRLEAQVQGIVVLEEPKPAAGKEVDISKLVQRVTEAGEKDRERDELQSYVEYKRKGILRLTAELITGEKALKDQLAEIEEHIILLQKKAAEKKEAHASWVDTQQQLIAEEKTDFEVAEKQVQEIEVPDIGVLQAELKQAEEINREIRAALNKYDNTVTARKRALDDKARLDKELVEAKKKSGDLDDTIDAIDAEKAAQISKAEFPLDGLGFTDDAVTFNGLPLDQASSAEQLRVSMAMAMALNPKLRVIRVTDGSLLDSESLKIVEDMANGGDFQVWLESVDETGKVGIYIEDGQVAAINK